jgi:hypothetical protein
MAATLTAVVAENGTAGGAAVGVGRSARPAMHPMVGEKVDFEAGGYPDAANPKLFAQRVVCD